MKLSAWMVWVGAALAASGVGCTPPKPVGSTGATETTTGDTSTTTTTTGTTEDPTGIQTVTSEPTTGGPGTTTGGPTTSSSTTEADVCAAPVEELTILLADPACEVLLHLDETAAPLGFHVVCGATGNTFMIGKDLGEATSCCADSPAIYPTNMGSPFYVLHYVDLQGPDGVGLLSNHTGRVVLDGLSGPGGAGPFTLPATWQDPAELASGMGCGVDGFSLENALSFDLGDSGKPLAGADLDALAAALADTALARALGDVTVARVVVVRTAPEEGGPAHDFVLVSTVREAG